MMPSFHRTLRAPRGATITLRLLLLAATMMASTSPAFVERLDAQPAPRSAPDRPRLDADADTNDWAAYYRYGVSNLRQRPERAAAALHWAAQLAPNRADAIYAQWGSTWLAKRTLLAEHFRVDVGNRTTAQLKSTPESRAVDALYYAAIIRNPFVHQRLEIALQAAVNDRQYGRGKWAYEVGNPLTDGWVAYTAGRYREAADQFAIVIHEDGRRRNPEARLWRARSLVFLEQYDSAAATLDTMLVQLRQQRRDDAGEDDASSAMLEYTLGVAHVLRNDRSAAKVAFGRAIEREIGFYMAHASIGGVKLAEGDTVGAIAAYEDAVAINGDDAVLRHDVGVVLLQAGRAAEAVRHLQRAVVLAPWYASAYYNLAVALEREGRDAEASRRYREFIARAPRSLAPQVEVAREHAAALEAKGR